VAVDSVIEPLVVDDDDSEVSLLLDALLSIHSKRMYLYGILVLNNQTPQMSMGECTKDLPILGHFDSTHPFHSRVL